MSSRRLFLWTCWLPGAAWLVARIALAETTAGARGRRRGLDAAVAIGTLVSGSVIGDSVPRNLLK